MNLRAFRWGPAELLLLGQLITGASLNGYAPCRLGELAAQALPTT